MAAFDPKRRNRLAAGRPFSRSRSGTRSHFGVGKTCSALRFDCKQRALWPTLFDHWRAARDQGSSFLPAPGAQQAFALDILDPRRAPRIVGIVRARDRRRLVEKRQAVAWPPGRAAHFGEVGEGRPKDAVLVLARGGDRLARTTFPPRAPGPMWRRAMARFEKTKAMSACPSPRSRRPIAMARSSSGAASPNRRCSSSTRARLFSVVAKSGWSGQGPSGRPRHCRGNSARPRAGRGACRRSGRAC